VRERAAAAKAACRFLTAVSRVRLGPWGGRTPARRLSRLAARGRVERSWRAVGRSAVPPGGLSGR
jgi:hypothetical protein